MSSSKEASMSEMDVELPVAEAAVKVSEGRWRLWWWCQDVRAGGRDSRANGQAESQEGAEGGELQPVPDEGGGWEQEAVVLAQKDARENGQTQKKESMVGVMGPIPRGVTTEVGTECGKKNDTALQTIKVLQGQQQWER
ncbi:hypothetical protein NDU88_008369 [Pleurodeles waltl]|uniref:Uncharacterized protein n=1 Tax=Pleurodeles waltl TaxID=8319 RepID=A0AAV7NVV8_PLEWA|nr:hypothetical protein NDU88_008369 [Pleurodeles waltl]